MAKSQEKKNFEKRTLKTAKEKKRRKREKKTVPKEINF
jgi:hypothetical protein